MELKTIASRGSLILNTLMQRQEKMDCLLDKEGRHGFQVLLMKAHAIRMALVLGSQTITQLKLDGLVLVSLSMTARNMKTKCMTNDSLSSCYWNQFTYPTSN